MPRVHQSTSMEGPPMRICSLSLSVFTSTSIKLLPEICCLIPFFLNSFPSDELRVSNSVSFHPNFPFTKFACFQENFPIFPGIENLRFKPHCQKPHFFCSRASLIADILFLMGFGQILRRYLCLCF